MRFLSVDYGTKRIGLAVCDELEFGAYPLATVVRSRSLRHDLGEIARLATKEEAGGIVVGLPVNADGTEGPSALAAKSFAASLKKHTRLPITLWDEFLTTAEAHEEMIALEMSRKKRQQMVDQMAAVGILRGFLAARKREREATAPTPPSSLATEAETPA